MNQERQGEAAQVKCVERCRPDCQGMSVARCCEQVDWIPNTGLLQKAVKACEHCHCNAAGEASFNSCRDRICFQWKERPGEFWRDLQPFDFAPRSRDDGHFFADLNRLFLLVRENVAK